MVASIGLAYVAGDTGVVAQGDMEPAHVLSPATEVGGIINTSTTWTQANSPYILTSDVQIAPEVTLTIESGVVVSPGASSRILTYGTLLVRGSTDNKVVFNEIEIVPGENAFGGPLFLIDIQHAQFYGGSVYRPTGEIYGSLRLRDSFLQDLDLIYLWYPVADSFIERNIFVRCYGISVGISGVVVRIRNNVFVEQQGPYAIENWVDYGFPSNPPGTIVEYNSFLSTDRIAVRLEPGQSAAAMDARNNYWGTTNPAIIANMILDRNDDLSIATTIPFKPFLTAPHPDTPPYTPPTPTPTETSTPTPTPTETPTLTPDLIATQTAISNQIATAVAATLTAIASGPTGTPGIPLGANQLSLPSIIR